MDTGNQTRGFITLLPGTIIQFYEQKGKSVPGIRGVFFPLPQWSQPHPVYIELLLQHTGYPVLAINPTVASYFKDYFALWARITTGPYPPDTKWLRALNMLLSGIDRMYCHRPQMQKGTRAGKRKYAANWCSSSSKTIPANAARNSMPTNWASPRNTLSTTVRQVTGRNVLDIIAHVVIVDVKAN